MKRQLLVLHGRSFAIVPANLDTTSLQCDKQIIHKHQRTIGTMTFTIYSKTSDKGYYNFVSYQDFDISPKFLGNEIYIICTFEGISIFHQNPCQRRPQRVKGYHLKRSTRILIY